MTELKEKQDAFDSNELLFFVANKKYFDFRVFKDPYKFASIIYHKGSLDDAKDSQNKMLAKLDEFKKQRPPEEYGIINGEYRLIKPKSSQEESGITTQQSDEQPDTSDTSDQENLLKNPLHRKQRLKILTPNQMLSRLPITLAQLKAGNNSEKLKNEIRQLLYSLHRSKNVQNNPIKVWLTLFKHTSNLYEH